MAASSVRLLGGRQVALGITQLMARSGNVLRTIRAIALSQRKAERLTLVMYYIAEELCTLCRQCSQSF